MATKATFGSKTCAANSKPRTGTSHDTNAVSARNRVLSCPVHYASSLIAARIKELDSMIKDAVKERYVAKELIDAWHRERKAACGHLETFKAGVR